MIKKMLLLGWLCLAMLAASNHCLAKSEVPLLENVEIIPFAEEVNRQKPRLLLENIEYKVFKDSTIYKCFLSDKHSMLNFSIRGNNIMNITLIAPINNYKPAFETLALVLKNTGVTKTGLQHLHDSLVESYNGDKEVVFDRTDKEFQIQAFQMSDNGMFVGIKCFSLE